MKPSHSSHAWSSTGTSSTDRSSSSSTSGTAGTAGQAGTSATAGTTASSAMASTPTFVVNADQAKLQSAPAFDYSSLSGMNQNAFAQRVYSHFGLNWSDRSSVGSAGTGISTGTGTGTGLDRDRSTSPGTSPSGGSRDANRPGSSQESQQGSSTSPQPRQ
jgi:hypothetical protein